tara:strand:- start:224 stop:634 length:411 start_codon:yes stop_codon:yes gene_type:complete
MTKAEKRRRDAYRSAINALDEGCKDQPELLQALAVIRDDRKNLQNLVHKARESSKDYRLKLSELRAAKKAQAISDLHRSSTSIKLTDDAIALIERVERRKLSGWRLEAAERVKSDAHENASQDFTDHTRSNCNQGL